MRWREVAVARVELEALDRGVDRRALQVDARAGVDVGRRVVLEAPQAHAHEVGSFLSSASAMSGTPAPPSRSGQVGEEALAEHGLDGEVGPLGLREDLIGERSTVSSSNAMSLRTRFAMAGYSVMTCADAGLEVLRDAVEIEAGAGRALVAAALARGIDRDDLGDGATGRPWPMSRT